MRTALGLLVALATFVGLPAGAWAKPEAPKPTSVAASLNPADFGAEAILVVHYIRSDQDYAGWNLWTWAPGTDGRAVAFTGKTPAGRYAVVPVRRGTGRQGFIVRRGNWAAKDVGQDRFADLDADGVTEIWLVSGDPRVHTDPAEVDLTVRLVRAFLDDADTIHLATTGLLDDASMEGAAITRAGKPTDYRITDFERSRARAAARLVYDVTLEPPVATGDVAALSLSIPGFDDPVTIYARDVLIGPKHTPLDAKLGALYTRDATTFRVWSPVSSAVDLLLFFSEDDPDPGAEIAMTPVGRGVWEATVPGDLNSVPYEYRYTAYGRQRTGPDIYARAATPDSSRSVVVNLARTDPDGWSDVTPPTITSPTDELIYEVHVRDFSIADESFPLGPRGTYYGLIHEGEVDGVKTGLAHLRELGVTAVHLMPIQDFPARPGEYNWGYWTALFNVPESTYSTDPAGLIQPIMDLKGAILGLHKAGIRVILDVVYNHTCSSFEHSPFDNAVPWYYFRSSIDGQLLNDAGTGNSIADERPMVRKYIVDSCVYWASQYKVDGFRFDLLGTLHPETVAAVCDALGRVRDDLTIYGEPWTGGGPIHFGKGDQKGTCFALFNDNFRNAVRGDLDGPAPGFATGPGGDIAGVRRGIMGAITDFAAEPAESINYVSAHDNLTLWDKITLANPGASDAQKRAMQKLALGVVLTSQGVPFLHSGVDFCRTKGGNHNSYNAGDAVNAIDWARKAKYLDVFEYVRGLAAIRAAHPAFRMREAEAIRRNLRFISAGTSLAFTLDGAAVGDAWGTILVAFNGEPRAQTLRLPKGKWNLVADHEAAGTATLRRVQGTCPLPPYSLVILHR